MGSVHVLDSDYELELIAVAISDDEWLLRFGQALHQHQWNDEVYGDMFDYAWECWQEHNELPGAGSWNDWIKEKDKDEREVFRSKLAAARKHKVNYSNLAGDRVIRAVQAREIANGLENVEDMLTQGDILEAIDELLQVAYVAQTVESAEIDEDEGDWFSGFGRRMRLYEAERTGDAILFPLPWTQVNHLLKGGIRVSKLVEILGNTNVGKSVTAAAIAFKTLMATEFHVLDLRTEDTKLETEARYDAALTLMERECLLSGDFEKRDKERMVRRFLKNHDRLRGRLHVREVPMNSPVAIVRQRIISHRRKHLRDGDPLLVILDMPDHLRSGRSRDKRHDDVEDVFTALKEMTREKRLGPMSMVVTKHAHRKSEGKMPTAGSVGGGYAAAQIPDLVIAMRETERKNDAKQEVELSIVKNRITREKGSRFSYIANLGTCEFTFKADDESSDEGDDD